MPDKQSQTILNAIKELDHTEVVYLLGDLCAIRGWDPQVTIGDTRTPGDLIARSFIPTPESIAILVTDGADLTSEKLQQFVNQSNEDRITIVTRDYINKTEYEGDIDETLGFLSFEGLAREVLITSTADILKTYIPDDSTYQDDLEQLIAENQEAAPQKSTVSEEPVPAEDADELSSDDESTSGEETDQTDYQAAETIPEQPENSISVENEFYGMEYLGHEYAPIEEGGGIFVALEIVAKEYDIDIRPSHFSLHSSEEFSYDGARPYRTDWLKTILKELPAPWGGSIETISAGGKIKFLAFFPTSGTLKLEKIRYTSNYAGLLTLSDEQIENQLGKGIGTETSTEILIGETNSKKGLSGLPDEVEKAILQVISASEL